MQFDRDQKNSTAVIFAGGRSSRMGKDKSLLPFGEYDTLCEYQYRRLQKIFKRVYVSAKSGKFSFDAEIITDIHEDSSPLVGLVSIFETVADNEIFVLSVDAPFVDKAVLDKLYKKSGDTTLDAIVAKSPMGTQPLCGIYRRSVLPKARQLLDKNIHRLNFLLKESNTKYIEFPNEDPFFNINHPEDYKKAVEAIKSDN